QSRARNALVAAKSWEPDHFRLPPEPGELALRIATGIAEHFLERFGFAAPPHYHLEGLFIPDGFERFRGFGDPLRQNPPDLVEQSVPPHPAAPLVQFGVKLLPWRVQPQLQGTETVERVSPGSE